MRIRKSIKKIMALGAGVSMLGATMLGATAAADLADYPAPFVKDGKFNGVLVVGDKAAAEDVIGVSDIAVSLQFAATKKAGSGSGTVTRSGDSVKIENAGDVLEINEILGNVTESLTGDDAVALKSYTVRTDKGTSVTNQYLRFAWGTFLTAGPNLQNGYGDARVVYTTNDDDEVGDYLYFKDGKYAFQYELEFEEGYESDISGTNLNDLEDETLTILGQDFEVTKATFDGNAKLRLELMGGAISDTFSEGETKTYTIDGKEYEVTNTIITDVGTVYAKFIVNGETTNKLEESQTDTLRDGTILGVNDILPNEAGDVTADLVEVFFGANRVVIEDTTTGATTTDGSVEINSEGLEDAEVNIDFTNTSSTLKINKITYTLTTDGASGDEPYIAKGTGLRQYLDEPQGMFSDNWDIVYEGLSDVGTSIVKWRSSGDDEYRLSFTNSQGVEYGNVKFLYGNGAVLLYGDDTDTFVFNQPGQTNTNHVNYTINKDDLFLVCHSCRSDTGVSRILKFDSVDTSNKQVELTDIGTGGQITGTYSGTPSEGNNGSGTFNVGGYTFDFNVSINGSQSNDTKYKLLVDLDDDGTLGGISAVSILGGGWIEFGKQDPTDPRTTQADMNVSVYTDRNNFDEAPGVNERFIINFTSASSVVDLGVITDAGIGLNPKSPADDDDLNLGMTNYGVLTAETDQTNDPDLLDIEYPKAQRLGQVFVTFGDSESSSASSGDAVVIQKIEVGATKLASEVSNVKSTNAILVGGPCANAAAADAMGNPADCAEGFEAGMGKIVLVDHGNGNVAMVVAGYAAADTRNAAAVIANYKEYSLSGPNVDVSKVSNQLTVTS